MIYKKLGDYIQQVNNRNRDLQVDTLLGVSITKKLIPSIANTVGTDMSTYKIIEKGQFAYGTITSRNGDKISIALAEEYEKALVSQIYIVFEVIDKNELLPEYLMMWFSRPEFDRYARYHSHGSTRESFDWEDLCEVELPVPSIQKQREIVAQYQAVENKIKVNEQICEKLEATAQTLYKQWFVDFEFPNEEGKPYKSSGGAMEYNQELEKDIPEGWEVKSLNELTLDTLGGDWGKENIEGNYTSKVLCIRGTDIPSLKKADKNGMPLRYILNKNLLNRKLQEGNIVIEISGGSPIQSTGRSLLLDKNIINFVKEDIICSNFCRIITIIKDFEIVYNYELQRNYDSGLFFTYENSSNGVKNLALNDLLIDLKLAFEKEYVNKINDIILKIRNHNFSIANQNYYLIQLQSLLLSRLATLEG
jgi:type I restriction enzyme S subunit